MPPDSNWHLRRLRIRCQIEEGYFTVSRRGLAEQRVSQCVYWSKEKREVRLQIQKKKNDLKNKHNFMNFSTTSELLTSWNNYYKEN